MLQGLSEADAEQVELRLLSDPEFGEEFDVMVDTIVDQYLDDELSPEERERAEQYFFKSESRREKLKFAAALKKRKADLLRQRWRGTPYLRAAAIAFIAVGVGTVGLRFYFSGPSLAEGLNALNNAYRQERPLDSRISGFNYAPVADQRSGGVPKFDSTQKELATTIILSKDSTGAGADVHHAIGQYFLSGRRFDEAIERFQKSLTLDPNNARAQTDLGTAFLERGKLRRDQTKTGEENVDFAQSLVHLNRALQLDSSNLEALFNRAMLYREMGLLPQAERDWRQYLEKDSSSKWADEAREKLRLIEQQRVESSSNDEKPLQNFLDALKTDQETAWNIVLQHYSSDGNTITKALLDSYLELDDKGDSKAAEKQLDAVSSLSQLELQNTGDNYTSDLVKFYKRSNSEQRRNLVRARTLMSQAYDLFLRSRVNEALDHYSQAEQIFRENGDEIESTLALYRMGHCYWLKPDLKKGEEIFTKLRVSTERKKYKWLYNQSLYRTASIRLTLNDHSEAIEYTRQALRGFQEIRDLFGTLDVLNALANQYRTLGNHKQSWSYLHDAVRLSRDKGVDPSQKWGVNTTIALSLAAMELHEAAREYQQEALRLALDLKPERPLVISRSYDFLAVTQSRLQNREAALTNIDLAFESGRRLEDQDSGREMMATALLHRGDILREARQFDDALASYDRSIALYEQIKYPYYTYPARRGRLQSYLAKGDDVATEAELNSVLEIFDTYRGSLKRESHRNTFFSVEQRVYDLAIEFAWSRKRDPELALRYCELSRGRSLLDAMQKNLVDQQTDDNVEVQLSATGEPLSASEIKQQIPDDAQIVQYAVLDDKLLIWVVNGNKITSQEKNVRSRELADRVQRLVRTVGTLPTNDEATFKGDAKELHKLLIAPIESLLDEKKLVSIVPDKVLHYLPFATLISEADDRYLIEKFRIQLAPSASIFLQSLKDNGDRVEESEERLLSVGNPTFDAADFESLQPLPAARREAQSIAELYRSNDTLLLDRNATEQAVRSGMLTATVAHFALHYVVDERHSLYSKMVLTAPGQTRGEANNGLLQIHEIYKMDLAHMRLVVLSACQTGIEQQYSGEGAISVARPFIARGVPLVVATLWPVDSSGSERLMTSFHRYRKREKLPTVEALQQAQLGMLKESYQRLRHPYYWAAFTVIGRYAKF